MRSLKDVLGDRPYATAYPDRPGWKVPGPSRIAAERVASKAKSQSAAILTLLKATPGGLTSDEIARRLHFENVRDSRPRVAELHRQGEVIEAGTRRGESGLQITVWKAAPPLPNYPHIIGEGR